MTVQTRNQLTAVELVVELAAELRALCPTTTQTVMTQVTTMGPTTTGPMTTEMVTETPGMIASILPSISEACLL